MSDEETQAQETEQTETAPQAETKSEQATVDLLWGQLSEEDKIALFNDANDHRRGVVAMEDIVNRLTPRQKAEAEKQIEEQKKEEKPKSDDPIENLSRQVAALAKQFADKEQKEQAQLEAQKKQAEAQKAEADFYGTLKGVLDEDEEYAQDEDMREFLTEAYSGHWIKHKPRDIQRSFKEYVKRHKERVGKQSGKDRQSYVQGKINDARATRGESGKGSSPGKNEWQPTVEEFDSGTMDERVKAQMGL